MRLDPGATAEVKLDALGAQPGNNGGIISPLNPDGLKYHVVFYTKEQAQSG